VRTRDCSFLIIPGYGGSGPDHWQSRWEARLPNTQRVIQKDWQASSQADWIHAIKAALASAPLPVIVIAHSLGVLATVSALERYEVDKPSTCSTQPDLRSPHVIGKGSIYIQADARSGFLDEHSEGEAKEQSIRGIFLVAPPESKTLATLPRIDPAFLRPSRKRLTYPSLLVASRNDPFCTFHMAQNYARDWGSNYVDAGESGHINTESGHGPWPEGLLCFATFLKTL
jgi:uncharacterized protein